MDRHINRVRIGTAGTLVELPWQAAVELRERLRGAGALELVQRFEAVGVSRPVVPTVDEEPVLLRVLEEWMGDVGEHELPTGVAVLRDALQTDLGW